MNEPILDKGTELQGLSTGVLFPSIDLFGGPVRKAVGPLTPIVGVSLFPADRPHAPAGRDQDN